MKKRVNRILIIAAALTLAAAVGVTFAFMFKKAKSENLLVPASISCTVHEKLDGTVTPTAPISADGKTT